MDKCPGPLRLTDQYIMFCTKCELRDVDDEWDEEAHKDAEYECFLNAKGKCVWKAHANRPCTKEVSNGEAEKM